jgi:hypothetical protein
MKYLILTPLLLTACASTALYPSQADMDRTCNQVVNASYDAKSELNRRTNKSNAVNLGVAGGLALGALTLMPLVAVVLPVYYGFDLAVDPFNKGEARHEFNNNMRLGFDMKCVEEDR